jgi:hypothetical protein
MNSLRLALIVGVTAVGSAAATLCIMTVSDRPTHFASRWIAPLSISADPTKDIASGFKVLRTTDSFTGENIVEYATSMTALDGPENLTGQLRIRCLKKSLEAYILFSRFFSLQNSFWGVSQNGVVLTSLMQGTAASEGRTAFLDHGEMFDFLNLLVDNRDTRIQVRISGGPKITFKPEMRLAAETVTKVRAECSSN